MKYLMFIGLLPITEIIWAFLCSDIAPLVYKKLGLNFRSIFKGVIEGIFLLMALANDYPLALIFIRALKLAKRLKHSDANAFNDFYLNRKLDFPFSAFGYVILFKNLVS